MSYEKFDIVLLGNGGAVAQINHWVGEAVKDCMDPNKDRETVRKVNLELKIQCSADGESAIVNYRVVPKFPADSAGQDLLAISKQTQEAYVNTSTQLPLGFDAETGEITTMRKTK